MSETRVTRGFAEPGGWMEEVQQVYGSRDSATSAWLDRLLMAPKANQVAVQLVMS